MNPKQMSIIYGVHPLREALKSSSRRCHQVVVEQKKQNAPINSILEICREKQIKVKNLSREVFRKKYGAFPTQGIIGHFFPIKMLETHELIRQAFEHSPTPTLVMLDGIQDPQNLGAIIRSAEVLGIQGIIIPKRRAAPLNETVAKCSAGAVERVPVAWSSNLSRTLEDLKKERFWVVGVDMAGDQPCYSFKFDTPVVLVIGGEEKGIRPLIKKSCDFLISIPMEGELNSLNASAACAVIFYEILRQKKNLLGDQKKSDKKRPG